MHTTLLTLFHDGDLFEIRYRGTIISSIVRFAAHNNTVFHLEWSDLHQDLKKQVIDAVTNNLTNHEES